MWFETSPYTFYVISAFFLTILFLVGLWWYSLKGFYNSGDDF